MLRISSSPSSSCSEDPGDTIVVEEASYYALPPAALNCTGGPMGPVRAAPEDDAAAADGGGDDFSDPLRQSFFPQLLGLPRMSRDLRQALNRRCSGLGKGQVWLMLHVALHSTYIVHINNSSLACHDDGMNLTSKRQHHHQKIQLIIFSLQLRF